MEYRTADVEIDDMLRLFANEERRRLVETLVDHPEQVVHLQDLADSISSGPSPSGSPPRGNRSTVALKHDHLPRLDDIGIVEYDWRTDTVRYHPDDRVERLLEFVRSELERGRT